MYKKYRNFIKILFIILTITFLSIPIAKYFLDEYFLEDMYFYILNHTENDYTFEISHFGKSVQYDVPSYDISLKTWTIRKKSSMHDYTFFVSIYSDDGTKVHSQKISWQEGTVHTAGAKGNFMTTIDILKEDNEIKVFYNDGDFTYGDPRNKKE